MIQALRAFFIRFGGVVRMELRTVARGSSLFFYRTVPAALTAFFFILGIYSAHRDFSVVLTFVIPM